MTQSDPQIGDPVPTAGGRRISAGAREPLPAQARNPPADGLVEEDLLVEDVSIDGMCGVY